MNADALWPAYASPDDLAEIDSIPLADRGLPDSTYAVLERAATLWPDRPAVTVLPDEAALRTVLDRYALNSEIKARL